MPSIYAIQKLFDTHKHPAMDDILKCFKESGEVPFLETVSIKGNIFHNRMCDYILKDLRLKNQTQPNQIHSLLSMLLESSTLSLDALNESGCLYAWSEDCLEEDLFSSLDIINTLVKLQEKSKKSWTDFCMSSFSKNTYPLHKTWFLASLKNPPIRDFLLFNMEKEGVLPLQAFKDSQKPFKNRSIWSLFEKPEELDFWIKLGALETSPPSLEFLGNQNRNVFRPDHNIRPDQEEVKANLIWRGNLSDKEKTFLTQKWFYGALNRNHFKQAKRWGALLSHRPATDKTSVEEWSNAFFNLVFTNHNPSSLGDFLRLHQTTIASLPIESELYQTHQAFRRCWGGLMDIYDKKSLKVCAGNLFEPFQEKDHEIVLKYLATHPSSLKKELVSFKPFFIDKVMKLGWSAQEPYLEKLGFKEESYTHHSMLRFKNWLKIAQNPGLPNNMSFEYLEKCKNKDWTPQDWKSYQKENPILPGEFISWLQLCHKDVTYQRLAKISEVIHLWISKGMMWNFTDEQKVWCLEPLYGRDEKNAMSQWIEISSSQFKLNQLPESFVKKGPKIRL